MSIYYVDTASAGGNGTTQNLSGATAAFKTIAAMQAKAGGYSAGDSILLKRGCIWRELFTVPSSGAAGNLITWGAYGSGAKPIISGANIITGWAAYAPGLGSTWQVALAAQARILSVSGIVRELGASATTLNDHEWFWAANVLYLRDDSGNPDGVLVEAGQRAQCILGASKAYVALSNLRVTMSNTLLSGAIETSTSSQGWVVSDCEVIHSLEGMHIINTGTAFVVNRTLFEDIWTSGAGFYLGGANAVATLDYCLFRNNRTNNIRTNSGTAVLEVDNCTVLPSGRNSILTFTGDTVNVKNSVLDGGGLLASYSTISTSSSGTVNYSNSYVAPGLIITPRAPGGTAGLNNLYAVQPKFRAQSRPCYVTVSFDNIDTSEKATDKSRVGDIARAVLGDAAAGVSIGCNKTSYISTWTGFINAINAGDDVSSHGRFHSPLTNGGTNALLIQYTGTGSACALTISGNVLSTVCTGAPADNLSINLTPGAVPDNRLSSQLAATIVATGKYTCTGGGTETASSVIADVAGQAIKASAYQTTYDQTKLFNSEVGDSITDIETGIQASIPAWNVRSFIYPTGVYNAAALAYLAAAGLLGARSWGTNGLSCILRNLELFIINGLNISDLMIANVVLSTVGTITDQSFKGMNFTNAGTTTSTFGRAQSYTNYRSMDFDGADYISRASIATMDLTKADWAIGAYVRPTSLASLRTIFFHGTDANNYHWLYIDTNGASHYVMVSGGSTVVSLDSPNATFSVNNAYPILVWSYNGIIYLMHGRGTDYYSTMTDQVTAAVAPANYSGTIYWGCSFNFGGSTRENFWLGQMDMQFIVSNPAFNVWAELNQVASWGGILNFVGHEDWTYDLWMMFFQIVKDYQNYSIIKVRTLEAALAEIRGNSEITANLLISRWYAADAGNYHPVSGSRLINAGVDLGYTSDFDGNPITGLPDIGAFENQPSGGQGITLGGDAIISQFYMGSSKSSKGGFYDYSL